MQLTRRVTINAPGLAEVILNMVVWHHNLLDSIVSNRGSLFTSKFWLSLCYFIGITALWKLTFRPLSTSSKTIGPNSYQWLSLRIIMPRMQVLATRLSTTSRCLMKKMLNPALSPKKTSTMPKNFRNGSTIKASSLVAMPPVIKFGWTANISRSNKIGSWKQSSSDFFEFCIQ